jgi:hypothetical protein
MVSRRKGGRRGVCYRELSPSHEARLCADRNIGPVAQSVEHLTFNQRVAGSSPARLTNKIGGPMIGTPFNLGSLWGNLWGPSDHPCAI